MESAYIDENDELIDSLKEDGAEYGAGALHEGGRPRSAGAGVGAQARERRANIYSRTRREGAGAGVKSAAKPTLNFFGGTAGWTRTTDLLVHSQAL